MWTAVFEETTELLPAELWPVLADVARWPELDTNIARLDITEPAGAGATFRLRPRGGPTLRFRIGHFDPPTRYSDICQMPLARMETIHELLPGERTTIRVRIEIVGLLAPLWGRVVGRVRAKGLSAQTARFVARARALRATS